METIPARSETGSRWASPRPLPAWLALWLVAFIVLGLILACVFVFPGYLVDHDLAGKTRGTLKPDALLKATNDIRTTLLQGVAGAFFLATAFFTWRQIRVSQEQLRLTQQQLKVSEDQQIAERFTRAIEQLGSASLDVRVGGIYALERIAGDSARDNGVIVEVLTALIRERVPWSPDSTASTARAEPPSDRVPSDIQAILTVLGRRDVNDKDNKPTVDLCAVDLHNASLRGAKLQRALLNDSNLTGADLRRAQLSHARLVKTTLHSARLQEADLQGARLIDSDLREAKLFGAHLEGANLIEADLEGARLMKAHFEGANLSGAHLDGARFRGMSWDEKTTWPRGFDPTEAALGAAAG
jgi:uncharacterized protein YjbI with pentapeptide repeats